MAKQIEFEFDIAGVKRSLNFGMYCWEVFCDKMGISASEIVSSFQTGNVFKAMRMLVISGIDAHDYLAGNPNSVKEVEVTRWINDDPGFIDKVFGSAMSVFIDSHKTEAEANQSEEDQKKSLSGSEK